LPDDAGPLSLDHGQRFFLFQRVDRLPHDHRADTGRGGKHPDIGQQVAGKPLRAPDAVVQIPHRLGKGRTALQLLTGIAARWSVIGFFHTSSWPGCTRTAVEHSAK